MRGDRDFMKLVHNYYEPKSYVAEINVCIFFAWKSVVLRKEKFFRYKGQIKGLVACTPNTLISTFK